MFLPFIDEFLGLLVAFGHGRVLLVVDTAALDWVSLGRSLGTPSHFVLQEG
jgi:hypothetical protein